MKHVFVFDPKAFLNVEWKMDLILDTIGEFFRTQEKPDFSVQYSRYRRNAIAIINDEAEKANLSDIIRVYAIGGDEVLFDCLNGVALFPNMELAAIPYTGSNDFLRIFGEYNIENFRNILFSVNAGTLPTDAIRCGVNYALNSCYIGMGTSVLKRLKDLESSGRKSSIVISKIISFFTFIFAAFDKQIAAREYKITIDDQDYSGQYCLIHIANSPYFEGRITGAKDATPGDGLLDVTLIRSSNPLKTLLSMRRYTRGKMPKDAVFFQAKTVAIESESQMWIQLDNEYIRDTNITLSVVQDAINMTTIENFSYPTAHFSADKEN